jgi:hypothetical protein
MPVSSVIPKSGLEVTMPAKASPRTRFSSEFSFGDRVRIDGDNDLNGRVTGFWWTADDAYTVEVTWLANGDVKSAWFCGWRLTRVSS